MLSKDDMYFYGLVCKQVIHRRRKNMVAKMPERIYSDFNKEEKRNPENIEAKYEHELALTSETRLLNEIFGETKDEQHIDT